MGDENAIGETPLTLALKNKSYKKATSLIEAGASIYSRNIRDESALHLIGKCSVLSLIRLSIRKVKEDCCNNSVKIAEKLIEIRWPLYRIVLFENVDVTENALVSGYSSQLSTRNPSDGSTALHVAVNNLDVDNVRLLLKYGSRVDIKNRLEKTPMSCLIGYFNQQKLKKKLAILKLLLSKTNKPFNNLEEFIKVVRFGNKDAIELFLKHGIDLSVTDFFGNTAIHHLAITKIPGIMEQLRSKSFDANIRNTSRHTALMLAAYSGNTSAVELLLDAGADIELTDNYHRTALFYAIDKSFQPDVDFNRMVFFGMDREGSFANDEERRQCVCILLERGANAFHETDINRHATLAISLYDLIIKEKNSWVMKIILTHLALQESRGTPIIESVRRKINSIGRLKEHFESSKQQLTVKIYNSLTLLDFLIATDKKFERYARNKELMSKLQEHIRQLDNSNYFHTLLKKRSTKAVQTVALKREAAQIICRIMKMNYDIFPLIAHEIVDYLDQESMKNLINALRNC